MAQSNNQNMVNAKVNVNDEYYTLYEDIEKELCNYKESFYNKIVYCNCDDYHKSQFFKYFVVNFNALHLKELITTCYNGVQETELSIWDSEPKEEHVPAYKCIIKKVNENINYFELSNTDIVKNLSKYPENKFSELEGNGDFRSDECVHLLECCDIIATNPPFSLFREHISLILSLNKDCILLGNKNASTYLEIFPYIKKEKLKIGFNTPQAYLLPNGELTNSNDVRNLTWWFTTLHTTKSKLPLILTQYLKNGNYLKYDNYDAIDIDEVLKIPKDYYGIMGVPMSFLKNYCDAQFEIIGELASTKLTECNFGMPLINNKKQFSRILIKRK